MENKEDLIGEGSHWCVKRIFIIEDGKEKTYVLKKSKNRSIVNVEKNLKNYGLIYSSGLPTLSRFTRAKNETEIIEAEDLNPPDKCDGYFVSPNTVRGCPSYGSILMKFYSPNFDYETFQKTNDINSELKEYLKNPSKIIENIEIRDKLIVKGAEGKVYSKKIIEIKNLNDFLIEARDDMKKASEYNIELFFDAFFFRVKESISHIEYKIADFDCININQEEQIDKKELYIGNLEYLTTSLLEYIEYFVVKEKKEEYFGIIKEFKNNYMS